MSSRSARASTEGLEAPAASQAASEGEGVDATKDAPPPTKAPEKAPEGNGSAVTTQAPPAAPAEQDTNFPSPDVRYSDIALDGAYLSLQRFQRGLATLNQMRDGTQQRFKTAMAELDAKYEADRAQLLHRFEDEDTDIEPRIRDMQDGIAMYEAMLRKAEQLRGPSESETEQQEQSDDPTQS